MSTVSNPASLSSVKAVFEGPNNLTAFVKGGAYVSGSNPAGIATSAGALKLSQFNGAASSVPLALSLSTYSFESEASNKGSYPIGTTRATASGGTGNYIYSIAVLTAPSGNGSDIVMTWAAPSASFNGVNSGYDSGSSHGVWRITVSDGVSSTYRDVEVSWNPYR